MGAVFVSCVCVCVCVCQAVREMCCVLCCDVMINDEDDVFQAM